MEQADKEIIFSNAYEFSGYLTKRCWDHETKIPRYIFEMHSWENPAFCYSI